MSHGPEWQFAERPTIEHLKTMGYGFVAQAEHGTLREGENQVLFRPHLIEALMRINGIDRASAEAAYGELAPISDNEAWLKVLRGDYARKVTGQETRQTLRVIDFLDPGNNQFCVTHQLRVKAENTRTPDVVVYVNGIALVVIEAKSPLNVKDKTGEAFEQIRQMSRTFRACSSPMSSISSPTGRWCSMALLAPAPNTSPNGATPGRSWRRILPIRSPRVSGACWSRAGCWI